MIGVAQRKFVKKHRPKKLDSIFFGIQFFFVSINGSGLAILVNKKFFGSKILFHDESEKYFFFYIFEIHHEEVFFCPKFSSS